MPSPSSPSSTRLLDLPDDALTIILTHLALTPILTPLSLRKVPAAFALACLSTRLHSLLRSIVHTIDVAYPVTLNDPAAALAEHVSIPRLHDIVTVCGPGLQVFKLPKLALGDLISSARIFRALSLHCRSLVEVSFADSGALKLEPTEWQTLFSGLKRVEIFAPSVGTVQFLWKAAKCLEEVVLHDVHPRAIKGVQRLIWKCAPGLTKLTVSFEIIAEGDRFLETYASSRGWPVRRLASYIAERAELFPKLRSLELATSSTAVTDHSDFPNRLGQMQELLQIEHRINIARQVNAARNDGSGITTIRVRANWLISIDDCVKSLEGLVSADTEVEVGLCSMSLVFPAPSSNNTVPSFTSFPVGSMFVDIDMPMLHMMNLVNVLGVGASMVMDWFIRLAKRRSDVMAVQSIKEVRWRTARNQPRHQQNICGVIADMMELCHNVVKLELPRVIVEAGEFEDPGFKRMVSSLSRLHVLHLNNTGRERSNDEIFDMPKEFFYLQFRQFVKNVSPFLHRLAASCTRLQCVYVEGNSKPSMASNAQTKTLISSTLRSLCKFEAAHPQTDIGTNTGLLSFWLS